MDRKYALVTGGSRGIGRAVCIRLAKMGYYVLINYVSNEKEALTTLELLRESGSDGEIIMFDVSDRKQTLTAIGQWQDSHPDCYIEILVNNAGICRDNLMVFMPEEDWNKVTGISLNGFFNTTQAVLQTMLVKKYGRIINVASISGLKGQPGQTNYSAAKGGLIAATRALAQEVARKNVTVNADMVDGLDEVTLRKSIPMNRFGTPEEVADVVGFLASQAASYITGETVSINGGLY